MSDFPFCATTGINNETLFHSVILNPHSAKSAKRQISFHSSGKESESERASERARERERERETERESDRDSQSQRQRETDTENDRPLPIRLLLVKIGNENRIISLPSPMFDGDPGLTGRLVVKRLHTQRSLRRL